MKQTAVQTIDEKPNTEVPVSVADRQVTERDAIEAMKRAGNFVVTETYLNDLETIGIHARRMTVKIQRGRAMVNQRRMEIVLENAADKIAKSQIIAGKDDKPEAGKIAMTAKDFSAVVSSFAQLSSKLTESQQFSLDAEEVYRPAAAPQDPDQVQNSFIPGAPIVPAGTHIIAQEVHMHSPQLAPASKETT